MQIVITDDFNLARIAESGQCFRWQKDDSGTYRIIHKEHILRIRVLEKNTFALSCSEDDYRNIWHDYFDLGTDYRSIRERISKEDDPFLAEACEYGKGIRILRQDPWEMLISFIISQNKNIPAIKRSVELLCEVVGSRQEDAEGSYYLFPTPEEILALSANVKHFFTLLGKKIFTRYGNQFFTSSGKEFFTSYGKKIFTSPAR